MRHELHGAVKAALALDSDEILQSTPSLGQLVGPVHSGLDVDCLSTVYVGFSDGEHSTALRSTTAEEAADDKSIDGFSDNDWVGMSEGSQRHEFQAEVSRLMDITISSLYTDKQVVLREIISNTAVAHEKARFHAVQDDFFLRDTKDLEIKVKHDPDAKTISIIDCGIGLF